MVNVAPQTSTAVQDRCASTTTVVICQLLDRSVLIHQLDPRHRNRLFAIIIRYYYLLVATQHCFSYNFTKTSYSSFNHNSDFISNITFYSYISFLHFIFTFHIMNNSFIKVFSLQISTQILRIFK